MSCKEFKQGEIIFKQGDFADVMFDILSGSVGVCVDYGTPGEKQLTVLGAGQFLGEMGLIEVYPRSATAVAMEDGTQLREISEREFSDYFYTQPERLLLIMRQLSQRLRERTADYEAAVQVRDELQDTRHDPGKRSKSLLARAKELIEFYNRMMSTVGENTDAYYMPDYTEHFHY